MTTGRLCILLVREMRFNFGGQVLVLSGTMHEATHGHLDNPPRYSVDGPRIRSMARVILRQRPVAAFSSFRPLAVRR
jgi:hypothetical protein